MERNLSPRRRAYDLAMRALVWLSALLTCALLVFLIGYIFYRDAGSVTWDFLSGTSSYIKDTIGILPNILNTLYIILLAMAIVLPLGVGAAIYLTEYAANRRVVELIEFATETLTGIPSIIFGLVGMLFFVQKMDLQAGVLAGSLTLVVMILPTIVRTTQESLKTVPQSYREGALALGAGKWRMVRTRCAAQRRGRHRDRLHPLRRPYHRRERGASLYRGLWSAAAWIQGGARILLGVAFCGAVSLRKRAGQV